MIDIIRVENNYMIKAILFDVDGVLIDANRTNYEYCRKAILKAGYKFITEKEFMAGDTHLTFKDIVRKCLPQLSEKRVNEIAFSRNKIPYRHKKSDLSKGMVETVKYLSKKFSLALVTGRSLLGVSEFLRVSGLKNYFPVISCVDFYKKPKPDPEPILLALKKLNLKPEQAIYVGDSLTDLQAAKALKMKFIGFYGISGKIFQEADANVKSFKELEKAILKLGYSL